jgi:hypothetical protein
LLEVSVSVFASNREEHRRSLPVLACGWARKKLIREPYVGYARKAIEAIGRETVSELMHGYLLPIERALVFVNDAMTDLKDGALGGKIRCILSRISG